MKHSMHRMIFAGVSVVFAIAAQRAIAQESMSVDEMIEKLTTSRLDAFPHGALEDWSKNLAIDPRVSAELGKFAYRSARLPESYVRRLPELIRESVFSAAIRVRDDLKTKECKPWVSVEFLASGFTGLGDQLGLDRSERAAVNDFESGFIRIEAMGCLAKGTAAGAMGVFLRPEFQRSVVSEIRSSSTNGPLVCDHTEVTMLGTSKYCYEPKANLSGDSVHIHHWNVYNADISEANAPVYFREILTSFHGTSNGVAGHVIAYVRGASVPSLVRGIARNRISATQQRGFSELERKL